MYIFVEKRKVLISCAVTAYADCWLSYTAAEIISFIELGQRNLTLISQVSYV